MRSGKADGSLLHMGLQGRSEHHLQGHSGRRPAGVVPCRQTQSFTENPNLSWETHASQLEDLKGDINDIGAKLCRLETIRRVVAPWQKREIDRIATTVRLMADNAEDAILFVNDKPNDLWLGTYQSYLNNL